MSLWIIVALPAGAGLVSLLLRRQIGYRTAAILCLVATLGAATVVAMNSTPLARRTLYGAAWEDGSNIETTGSGVPYQEATLGSWFDTGEIRSVLGLRLDPLSGSALLLVLSVAVLLLAQAAISGPARHDPAVVGGGALLVAALALVLLAVDLLLLYAAWQLLSVVSYSLVSHCSGESPGASARWALVTRCIGGAALMLAVLMLGWEMKTLHIGRIVERATSAWVPGEPEAIAVAGLLLIASLAAAAAVPLHAWLVGVARSQWLVAALHLTIVPVVGIYLLARFQVVMVLGAAVLAIAAGLGAVTALSAGLAAAAQRRARESIAFGVVAQVGLVCAAMGAGGMLVGVVHMAASVLSFTLLMIVTDLREAQRERGRSGREEGNRTSCPRLRVLAIVGAASWAGVPFVVATAGSREGALWALLQPPIGNLSLWLSLLFAAGIAAFVAARWLLSEFSRGGSRTEVRRTAWIALLPAGVAAAALLAAGLTGVSRSSGEGGLAVRMLERSMALPGTLSLGGTEAAAWAATVATQSLRSGLALIVIVAFGAGIGAALLLYRYRPGLRRALSKQPAVASVLEAAAGGWYVQEVTRALVTRPFLSTVYVLRDRRAPAAQVPDPPPERAPSRSLVPKLMALVWAIGLAALLSGYGVLAEDPLAWLFALFCGGASALSFLLIDPRTAGRGVVGSYLLTAVALQGAILAPGLVLTLVFWGLAVTGLIRLAGADAEGTLRRAVLRAGGVTGAGWLCLAVATAWLLAGHAQLTGAYTDRVAELLAAAGTVPGNATIGLLFLVGFGLLAGLFPLHGWLLRISSQAPPSLMILLSGAWVLAAAHGLVRIVPALFPEYWTRAGPALALTGVVGVLVSASAALGQRRLGGVVGYLAVQNSGLALIGLAAWNIESAQGSILLLIAGATAMTGLRAAIGRNAAGGPGLEPGIVGGSFGARPRSALVFSLLLLSAIGVAGSAGFIGVALVLLGSFRQFPGIVAVALVGSVGTAYVIARAHQRVVLEQDPEAPADRLAGPLRVVLVTALVVSLGLGLFPQRVLMIAARGVSRIMSVELRFEPADPEIGDDDKRVALRIES